MTCDTTQSSLVRLWSYTGCWFPPLSLTLDGTERKRRLTDLRDSYRNWGALQGKGEVGFQCRQQTAIQSGKEWAPTEERLERSCPVFFSSYCPGLDNWRQKTSSTSSQGGIRAFRSPPGWKDREVPRKARSLGGSTVEWWGGHSWQWDSGTGKKDKPKS